MGTVMTNLGLELSLNKLGIPFERAKVGDRYVLEQLNARGWQLGGESSGHIVCLDLTTTGDAIVAALQVLTPMVDAQRGLADLKQGLSKLPQTMINVEVRDPAEQAGCTSVVRAIEQKNQLLKGRGRVLVRPSGTEPVIRVMVEGEDADEVDSVARELAEVVRVA